MPCPRIAGGSAILAVMSVLTALAVLAGVAWPSAQSPSPPAAPGSVLRPAPLTEPPLPDLDAFIAEGLKKLRSNDTLRSAYGYTERETRYRRDRDGRVTPEHVRVYEVTGSPEPDLVYRRLVSDDGVRPHDLERRDAEQRRKEQDWYGASARDAARAREARRRRAAEAARAERAVIDELTTSFDVRMTGRETVDGRPAITFTYEPRPGARPSTRLGRTITNFRGHAWIDEQEHELVRMTSKALGTVSVRFGFIVRLLEGSTGIIERRKADGVHWLPTYSRFTGSARVFFVWRIDVDQATEFLDYRRIDER